MKIVAQVFRMPNGLLRPQLYAVNSKGKIDRGSSETLLEFISELGSPIGHEFESLLSQAESSTYIPKNPDLPDWSVNDKNVWVRPPRAMQGKLCISNENIAAYSSDEGIPQQFTISQYRNASVHWKTFQKYIKEKELSKIVGEQFKKEI
jgi:hypothetical protein